MTYILKCTDCGNIVEFMPQMPHVGSLYGASYLAGAAHERENCGEHCTTGAARCLRLIGIRVTATNNVVLKQEAGEVTLTWEPLV